MGAHVVYRLGSLFYTLLNELPFWDFRSWKSRQLPWLKLHTIIIYAINNTLYWRNCLQWVKFVKGKASIEDVMYTFNNDKCLFFGEIIYNGQDIHGDFIKAKYRQSTTDVICCCWRCMNYFETKICNITSFFYYKSMWNGIQK